MAIEEQKGMTNYSTIRLARILQQLNGRELCLIYSKADKKRPNAILERNFFPRTIEELKEIIQLYRVEEKKINLYMSVAKYDMQSASIEIERNTWKDNHWQHIEEYDFIIDVDKKEEATFEAIQLSAEIVKEYLDIKGWRYLMKFSGRGFHFTIKYSNFESDLSFDPFSDKSIYSWYRALADQIKEHCSDLIDTAIYDSRRVIKIPDSITYYPEGNYYCSRLRQIRGFNRNDYIVKEDVLNTCQDN